MTYEAKVLADSIASGVRLTTLQVTYPRIIHSEVMTHRVFSRNAASSRAIPLAKSIERVMRDPFVPEAFAHNVRGMQGGSDFDYDTNELAREGWMRSCADAMRHAEALAKLGVHKHWANRLLEPYSWITTIVSGTEWENFFALRCHKDAAPEFQKIAGMMRATMATSTPEVLAPGGWHLPMVQPGEMTFPDDILVKLSVARCARVSYLTHEGKRDAGADHALYDKLVNASPRHLSPCEHAARVATVEDVEHFGERSSDGEDLTTPGFVGNFAWPWIQHRKLIVGEAVFGGANG